MPEATTLTRPPRSSGPAPASGRIRVTVYLDESLAEWGKRQEGGLSELLRRLLGEARHELGTPPQHYPADLTTPYKRLIDRKLAQGLTPEEEQELAGIRARMNAFDRSLPSWERSEAIAAAIDRELSDLRHLIETSPKKPRAARAS